MVRGADFDNGVPQSDNPIENGPNKAHGVGATVRSHHSIERHDISNELRKQDEAPNRAHKAAPMPEETGSGREVFSGQGSGGAATTSGSGKGGHEPKTLGERKGLGPQGV